MAVSLRLWLACGNGGGCVWVDMRGRVVGVAIGQGLVLELQRDQRQLSVGGVRAVVASVRAVACSARMYVW